VWFDLGAIARATSLSSGGHIMADFVETIDKMFEAEQRFGIPIVCAH
jgi:hypothetical protein